MAEFFDKDMLPSDEDIMSEPTRLMSKQDISDHISYDEDADAAERKPHKKNSGKKASKKKSRHSKKHGKKNESISNFFARISAWFKKNYIAIKTWAKQSKKNLIITIALLCLVVVLIVGSIVLAVVNSNQNDSNPLIDAQVVDDEQDSVTLVDPDEYAGTLLEKTSDAGKDYLEDTLFIGDSNMARLVMYGLLTYDNVIGVESMGIQGVTSSNSVYFSGYSEPVTIVEAVKLMKPRRIIISFGTNNILSGSAESFVKEYDKALNKIHDAYPYADIIIMSIHPLGENRSNKQLKQSTVDEYNLALINYAKENGYPFLDAADTLKDKDGWLKDSYAYSDGIHLTKDGLSAMLTYVRTHARIVDDTRPKPLGSIPQQVAPPVKETEEDFNPSLVASNALSALVNNSSCKFTVADTEKLQASGAKIQISWTWSWPKEGAKGGSEESVGASLANAFLAQNSVTSGQLVVSYNQNSDAASDYLFTVSVYNTKHEHKYTWTVDSSDSHKHVGTCSADGCTEKTITHTAVWESSWKQHNETTHIHSCIGYSGCTLTETQAHIFGETDAEGYQTCSACGYKKKIESTTPSDTSGSETGGATDTGSDSGKIDTGSETGSDIPVDTGKTDGTETETRGGDATGGNAGTGNDSNAEPTSETSNEVIDTPQNETVDEQVVG